MLGMILTANAQTAPGLYAYFSKGTLPASSSNQYTTSTSTNTWGAQGSTTNFLINVSAFDYAGLTITGAGSSTTTNQVSLFKSFDNGATFESPASFIYGLSYTSGTVTTTSASLDLHGVTHLALVMGPVGAASVTNASITLNLKSPWVYATPPLSYGKSPGTPIVVPSGQTTNGWAL